jgi:hypothetical protein
MLLVALVVLPLLVLVVFALLDEAGRVLLPDVDRSGEPEVTAAAEAA